MTSWAQYKAFVNHAEKFNRKPEDVSGANSTEPPKVTHDGPGTHGAGGGGSGGGAIGQGNDNSASKTRGNDINNGKPNDHAANVASLSGVPGVGGPAGSPAAGGGSGHTKGGRSNSVSSSATTAVEGNTATEGERKPSGADDAWSAWEREEMEDLLKEVRGHLGESNARIFSFCRFVILVVGLTLQSCTPPDSSKRKISPTTSCSM